MENFWKHLGFVLCIGVIAFVSGMTFGSYKYMEYQEDLDQKMYDAAPATECIDIRDEAYRDCLKEKI